MTGTQDPSPSKSAGAPTRVLGLVEGEASSALSGVAGFLFEALRRHGMRVQELDYAPHGLGRFALAAVTIRPNRAAWRARFHAGRLAQRTLSRILVRRLAAARPEFDVALQVHGWVQDQPRPYALYLDQTRLMAERGWPDWLPFARREREELLGLEKRMYRDAAQVFVMGSPVRDSLLDDYGVDPGRVSVVGGGLPFAALPSARPPSQDPEILFVGRDFERKGGHVLLRAFETVRARVPAARLHVVGAAGRFDGPGIVNHGRLSRRDLAELYRRARVFCLPSFYEPYGLVLIEAMAHGVPCVGASVQAIPEILDAGRVGLLVPPGEPEPLAAAILELLADHELAGSIGAAGRDWVARELTWDRVAARVAPALARARQG